MPAELCSTGEQKALLIGIILSHARLCGEIFGSVPILLLDEIAAHLDAGRRAALFSILEELGCQAFMTGTDASLFSSIRGRAQFLTVDHGAVWADRSPLTMPALQRYASPMNRLPSHPKNSNAMRATSCCRKSAAPGQQKLKRARVLVIGAGGLGAPVLQYLAAAGVGTLGIVDDDTVSLSNLQRQIIHDTEAVGMPKLDSAGLRHPAHQSA